MEENKKSNKKIFYVIVIIINILVSGFIYIYNNSSDCSGSSGMLLMEVNIFNQQFEQYEGTKSGANARALLRNVLKQNSGNGDMIKSQKISVIFCENESSEIEKIDVLKTNDYINKISKIISVPNPAKTYIIEMRYDSEGLVNGVVIIDAKLNNEKRLEIEQQAEFGIDKLTLENQREQERKKEENKEKIIDIIKIISICGLAVIDTITIIIYIYQAKKVNNLKNAVLRLLTMIIIIGAIIILLIYYNSLTEPESIYKPVIYLYPTETTEVTVKVGKPEKLTHTYPKYKDKWKVTANPNGDLVDSETGRNLYCLYWEGINTVQPNMQEGFIVKGEDTIKFLEEKLEILGLNEREANEFIIYWLPKLEENKYNYIRFQKIEEINENMPLEITPKPDTVIRIVMEYKGINKPIEVKEQKLTTPERKGFTVVEWGGTCIN